MSQELPGGKSVDWVFEQIAEHNDEKATEAADELIRTAEDKDLRTSMIKLVTAYSTAKDSIKMHETMEELIGYIKKQYGLILIQGFRFGQGYQQKVSNEQFTKVLKDAAAKAAEAAGVDNGEPKSEN